jgi:hypothetical protein
VSVDMVMGVGKAVVLVGALLELRHLIAAIAKHFNGCASLRSVLARAGKLDDATLVGMVVCAILAVAIAVTIYGELAGPLQSTGRGH